MDNHPANRLRQLVLLGGMIVLSSLLIACLLFYFREKRQKKPRQRSVAELMQELTAARSVAPGSPGEGEAEVVRAAACNLLAQLHSEASPAIDLLLDLAQRDSSLQVRMGAIRALGAIGDNASNALPVLFKMFKENPDPFANGGLIEAIPSIAPADSPVISETIDLVRSDDSALGNQALSLLGAFGRRGKIPQTVIMDLLKRQTNPARRLSFVNSLGEAVPKTSEVAHLLEPALFDVNHFVQQTAIETIGKLGPGAVEAVPSLVKVLEDTKTDSVTIEQVRTPSHTFNPIEVHRSALQTLGLLGHYAGAAIPALSQESQQTNNAFRFDAALAMLEINGDCGATRKVFTIGLDQENPDVRQFAMGKLGEAGRLCPDFLDLVIAAIRSRERTTRLQALNLVGNFGTNAIAAEEVLKEASTDPNPSIRRVAGMALTNLHMMHATGTKPKFP